VIYPAFFTMLLDFGTVLTFLILGFVFVSLLIGALIRPNNPSKEKLTTYECGEIPVGRGWLNYNSRFYIIALIFVIFDVEVAFILPVATVYRNWVDKGAGMLAFVELLIFALILFTGLVYLWIRGDLNWVKAFVQGGKGPMESVATPHSKEGKRGDSRV
jgi:NADH-quinone oxidoreductase subunit A